MDTVSFPLQLKLIDLLRFETLERSTKFAVQTFIGQPSWTILSRVKHRQKFPN